MSIYFRHTDANHAVRPDRVTRTGVIPPLVGYSPQQDVMAVAADFTRGPYMFTQDSTDPTSARGIAGLGVPQLMGIPTLMGVPMLMGWSSNPFKQMWLRFKANSATKKIANALHIRALQGLGSAVPNGPASAMAPQLVPMMGGRVELLSMIAAKNFPTDWSDNAMETIQRRWNGRDYRG
jgi:hypothetical protein